MADRVMPGGEDENFAYYVWDSGWLVSFNKHTREWTRQRIPHPSELLHPVTEPNRELSAEVSDDDGN